MPRAAPLIQCISRGFPMPARYAAAVRIPYKNLLNTSVCEVKRLPVVLELYRLVADGWPVR